MEPIVVLSGHEMQKQWGFQSVQNKHEVLHPKKKRELKISLI